MYQISGEKNEELTRRAATRDHTQVLLKKTFKRLENLEEIFKRKVFAMFTANRRQFQAPFVPQFLIIITYFELTQQTNTLFGTIYNKHAAT